MQKNRVTPLARNAEWALFDIEPLFTKSESTTASENITQTTCGRDEQQGITTQTCSRKILLQMISGSGNNATTTLSIEQICWLTSPPCLTFAVGSPVSWERPTVPSNNNTQQKSPHLDGCVQPGSYSVDARLQPQVVERFIVLADGILRIYSCTINISLFHCGFAFVFLLLLLLLAFL